MPVVSAQVPPLMSVVDIEGDGHSAPDVVELAIVTIRNGFIEENAAKSWIVKPRRPISPFASKIHGIRDRDVIDAPEWPAVANEIEAALAGSWLVAHHASVELAMLRRHLPRWRPTGTIDTIRLAKSLDTNATAYGLDVLCHALNISDAGVTGHRHRAGFDAILTARLFAALAKLAEEQGASFALGQLDGPALLDPSTNIRQLNPTGTEETPGLW